MRNGRPLFVALFVLTFSFPLLGAAQGPAAQRPSAGERRPLRVVVDGSKTPNLIPDRVAIGMFMSGIAIPSNADKRAVGSMTAKVASMKLSLADMSILRKEASNLHGRLMALRDSMAASNAKAGTANTRDAVAKPIAAVESRNTLAMESYGRLLETLSPEGARKLATHVTSIKRQMKAVGRAQ